MDAVFETSATVVENPIYRKGNSSTLLAELGPIGRIQALEMGLGQCGFFEIFVRYAVYQVRSIPVADSLSAIAI